MALWLVVALLGVGGCTRTDYAGEDSAALLEQAREQVKIFNFAIAQPMFAQLTQDLKEGSDDWSEAMIGLAVCAWHRSPNGPDHVATARTALERLVAEESAGGRFKAHAAFMLGRIAEVLDYPTDVVDLEQARKHYRRVIETWPQAPIAPEAELRLAGSYLQEFASADRVREGIAVLERWLAKYPGHMGSSLAARLIGDAYHLSLDDHDTAFQWYLRAAEMGLLNTAQEGNFYWMLASLAEEEDRDVDVAVRYYQKIIQETPRSGRAYEAQLRLAALRERFPERNITVPVIPVYQATRAQAEGETP